MEKAKSIKNWRMLSLTIPKDADYIDVVTDSSKASRVAAKVIDVMGYDAYEMMGGGDNEWEISER